MLENSITPKSIPERKLWSQFDSLQMGMDWDEEDIKKATNTY